MYKEKKNEASEKLIQFYCQNRQLLIQGSRAHVGFPNTKDKELVLTLKIKKRKLG